LLLNHGVGISGRFYEEEDKEKENNGFGVWLQTLAPDQQQVKFGECSSHPEVELDPESSLHDEPVEGLSGGDVSTQALLVFLDVAMCQVGR